MIYEGVNNDYQILNQWRSEEMTGWPSRIQSALEMAEEKLNGAPLYMNTEEQSLTRNQLDLAKALWRLLERNPAFRVDAHEEALRDFTELIESL